MFHGGEAKAKMYSENDNNRQSRPIKSKIAAKILQKKSQMNTRDAAQKFKYVRKQQ
jgi:hypothetical protein